MNPNTHLLNLVYVGRREGTKGTSLHGWRKLLSDGTLEPVMSSWKKLSGSVIGAVYTVEEKDGSYGTIFPRTLTWQGIPDHAHWKDDIDAWEAEDMSVGATLQARTLARKHQANSNINRAINTLADAYASLPPPYRPAFLVLVNSRVSRRGGI
jgi:hypothetical protein